MVGALADAGAAGVPSGAGGVRCRSAVAASGVPEGLRLPVPDVPSGECGFAAGPAVSLSGQDAGTTGVNRLSNEGGSSAANRSLATAADGPHRCEAACASGAGATGCESPAGRGIVPDMCRPSPSGRAGVRGGAGKRWRFSEAAWPARSEELPIVSNFTFLTKKIERPRRDRRAGYNGVYRLQLRLPATAASPAFIG